MRRGLRCCRLNQFLFQKISQRNHIERDILDLVALQVAGRTVTEVVEDALVGQVLQMDDILTIEADSLQRGEQVLDLVTGPVAVIFGVLRPFIQLEIDGLSNFIGSHVGQRLNQMPAVTAGHVAPFIFGPVIQAISRFTQRANEIWVALSHRIIVSNHYVWLNEVAIKIAKLGSQVKLHTSDDDGYIIVRLRLANERRNLGFEMFQHSFGAVGWTGFDGLLQAFKAKNLISCVGRFNDTVAG